MMSGEIERRGSEDNCTTRRPSFFSALNGFSILGLKSSGSVYFFHPTGADDRRGWGWYGTRFFTRPFFHSLSIGVAVIGLFCPEGAGKKGQFNELMCAGGESPRVTTNRLQIDNQSGVRNPFNGSSLQKATGLRRSKILWRLYQGIIMPRVPFKNKLAGGLRKS